MTFKELQLSSYFPFNPISPFQNTEMYFLNICHCKNRKGVEKSLACLGLTFKICPAKNNFYIVFVKIEVF